MKIIPNFFRIDRHHKKINQISDNRNLIETIIKTAYDDKNILIDNDLNISELVKDENKYYLYSYRSEDKESDWANFLPGELKNDKSFFQTKVSLLLFIELIDELFVIVGGNAYWIIAPYIDHVFGLTFYDRLITLEDDEAISTKSRGLTGKRAGLSEQFRDQHRMIDYLQFGKIPKELHIKLSRETSLLYFQHLLSEDERLKVVAAQGFKLNKEVDFEDLDRTVRAFRDILSISPKEEISSYINIQNGTEISNLKKELSNKIYNNINQVINNSQDSLDQFEFDFCNPNNIEAFYNADSYRLYEPYESGKRKDGLFATINDKSMIYRTVLDRAYQLHSNNPEALISYLYSVQVSCYLGTKMKANSGFMYHFNTELNYDGRSYFLIDSKWYKLKDTFLQSLESKTLTILKSTKLASGIVNKSWDYDSNSKKYIQEGEYNMLYDTKDDYIVIDTIISDGIELCDILNIVADEIYLIHVKHSFTAKVRELTNQILISARRLSEAISSKNRSFFDEIYDKLVKKGRSTNGLDKDEFFSLFITKTPVYVLATASHLTEDYGIIDNIERYDSNIARFSLTTCAAEIRSNYYDFKTVQITRNTLSPQTP